MSGRAFNVPKPCADCPFRKVGGIRLMAARVREIAQPMLSSQGHTFDCHKTVDYDDEGTGGSRRRLHCAGALIFAEKHQTATQMMRIAERCGSYDAAALMADAESVAAVFDSLPDMLAAALDRRPRQGRKRA